MECNKSGNSGASMQQFPAASAIEGVATALPQFLEKALAQLSLGDRFFEAAWNAAEQAGCELLFEIPAMLFAKGGERAAAIRCINATGTKTIETYFFLLFDGRNGLISVIAPHEAPTTAVELTRSYAGVLGMMAGDRQVVAPLIQ